MKKSILKIVAITAIGFAFVACKNETKKAETSEAEAVKEVSVDSKFAVIASESMVIWKANKIVGGHEGTINVKEGTANFTNNNLVGGTFTFDIASLKCTDIPEDNEGNAKLVKHLLNEDFFDVEKFSMAKFEITKVENETISGNLTLKGITKNVSFPAKVTMTDNDVSISTNTFTIDRTEFNINYNSGKVMDAAQLGDYLIRDEVELKLNIKAKKS